MKAGIEFYVSILLLSIASLLSITLISSNLEIHNARELHSAYIIEIENSNLSDSVIEECKEDAKEKDCTLTVSKNVSGDSGLAKVSLTYSYSVPLLGVESEHTIDGYARQ